MLNKPYLSIQEMIDKTEKQRRAVKDSMDELGSFHPSDASILDNQKSEDYYLIKETLRNIPLTEFIQKGTTLGNYLVADKVHSDLLTYSQPTDKVPLISGWVIDGWEGADLKVTVADDESFQPNVWVGGASAPTATVGTAVATLSPITFTLAPSIAGDLNEDTETALIPWCLQRAALAMGKKATGLALAVLKMATDGWGTVNGGASGDADETKWAGATTFSIHNTTAAKSLMSQLTVDRWVPDTLVMTTEAWEHSMHVTLDALANNINLAYDTKPMAEGFDFKIKTPPPLDCIFWDSPVMCNLEPTGTAMTNCVTILFNRTVAMLTGRKRWMQIDKYAHPIEDLANMIISCRQDSVTCYDDAIGVITET